MIDGKELTDTARAALQFSPAAYEKLTVPDAQNLEAQRLLGGVKAEQLFLPGKMPPQDRAAGALAGLWLWMDDLETSHLISQSIDTPTGSFWHAIMHRREGDFSNSKYWYARVGAHPALDRLGGQTPVLLHNQPADKSLLKLTINGWSAPAFVDLVAAVHDRPDDPRRKLAVALQRLEWRVLFEWCVRE